MPVQHDQTLQGDTGSIPPTSTDQPVLDSDDKSDDKSDGKSDDKSDDAEYVCCTLEFDNEFDHLSHMISHIAENIILLQRVQCDYCNYSFNNHNELQRHLPKHLGFNCYYCHQHIPKWGQLVQHVMNMHNYKIKNAYNSKKQHHKFMRRATGGYKNNKKRFKRKFKTNFNKQKLVWNMKTESGNYTNFVSTIKTEPYVKSEPIFGANVNSDPIFNLSIIKTEPMDFKTEPFDYY